MNIRRKLVKDAALLAVTLFLLLAAAVAWFINRRDSDLSGTTLSAASLIDGGISLDNVHFAGNEEMLTSDLPENLAMRPVSGDGINLYLPQTNVYTGEVVEQNGQWVVTVPEANRDYYVQDIYVRADTPAKLSLLSDGSSVTAVGGSNQLLGNISGDYVAGIARIAFVQISAEGDKKLLAVWIPNNAVQISRDNETGRWSFIKNGQMETNWKYYDGTQEKPLSDLGVPCGDFFAGENEPSLPLLELPSRTGQDGYHWYAHLQVVVWLEGLDRDAYAPQMGGNLSIAMKFRLDPAAGEEG